MRGQNNYKGKCHVHKDMKKEWKPSKEIIMSTVDIEVYKIPLTVNYYQHDGDFDILSVTARDSLVDIMELLESIALQEIVDKVLDKVLE